jgi:probable selenium-dependent hydroxylase accessory protein YqeC
LDAAGVLPRILVTPTTKMFVPPKEAGLYDYYFGGGTADIYSIANPAPGVTLAGNFNSETGKLESLPNNVLEKIAGNYDCMLVEGDGSRGLPLKAWAEHEPVVPPFTDVTFGVIPIKAVGMTVSEKTVFRLPLFTQLTGAKEGDIIKLETLVHTITGTKNAQGLFDAAIGRRILFINQVETEAEIEQARKLVSILPEEFSQDLFKIIAGSVKNDRVMPL